MATERDSGRVKGFWDWIERHEAELRRPGPNVDELLEALLEQLHLYCSELYFELSSDACSAPELVITAHGDVDRFDAVETLIAAAPRLDGWVLMAFKPAAGFAFETVHGAAKIDARTSWFLPLESKTYPSLLGVRLACSDYDAMLHEEFLFAARVVIETGLGERSAAHDVHRIEVERTPSQPESRGYLELSKLPDFIARREAAKLRA